MKHVWILICLKQFGAQCSTLEYIMHGYCKGIVVGSTGGAITSTIDLAILVGTIGTIVFFIFLL
jgi:hypothetical protein